MLPHPTRATTTPPKHPNTGTASGAKPTERATGGEPVDAMRRGGGHGADVVVRGGRRLGEGNEPARVDAGARSAGLVAVRAATDTSTNVVHDIATRKAFDAMFKAGATVTAGAPTELKFLIDRQTHDVYFLPPKFDFHFDFYRDVLHGTMTGAQFNERAYNRPDRDFIAGTVTAYDSYLDPQSGKQGQVCFSYWPTDRFDAALLKETHDAVRQGLKFLGAESVAFRPGGPIQDKIVERDKAAIASAGIAVKTNIEISKGLKFMSLSEGKAVGRLVVVDKGAAMPVLTRKDVVLFLGDVPPEAPPVAAIFTSTVQTYNSHLGIKYRQDDTPYFYQSFTDEEMKKLKAMNGKPVTVQCGGKEATVTAATQAQAAAYLRKIKPKGHVRLTPNLTENRARGYDELKKLAIGTDGRWDKKFLASYGRKTGGVVELAHLAERGALAVGGAGAPKVVAPTGPMALPANWYSRFIKEAQDPSGVTFSERIKALTKDRRVKTNDAWKAQQLKQLRDDIEHAAVPATLLTDLKEQVAVPYLKAHPGMARARLRSSSPVVEDGGRGKLPNMAGAFDSHTARWKSGRTDAETVTNATKAMAEALLEDYASVFNDRAIAELQWHNVDLDEGSVTMAILVTPNEDDEVANAVVRVNTDLAGFFSITGEAQFGENLVTNPQAGAAPDTWIDGNYDVLNGVVRQDIEYERTSNLTSRDASRVHAFTDREINVVYDAMNVIRDHFAALDGKRPEEYIDECEVKVTDKGQVLFKQERPWVE